MAIDPQTTDTVTIPQLDPLTLALETFLVGANADGGMGNFTAQGLANFIAPYISAIGSSGFVPSDGFVLPNPIEGIIQYTIVSTGEFTWDGGLVVTVEPLNILSSDGVTWNVISEIPIDLIEYVKKIDILTTVKSINAADKSTILSGVYGSTGSVNVSNNWIRILIDLYALGILPGDELAISGLQSLPISTNRFLFFNSSGVWVSGQNILSNNSTAQIITVPTNGDKIGINIANVTNIGLTPTDNTYANSIMVERGDQIHSYVPFTTSTGLDASKIVRDPEVVDVMTPFDPLPGKVNTIEDLQDSILTDYDVFYKFNATSSNVPISPQIILNDIGDYLEFTSKFDGTSFNNGLGLFGTVKSGALLNVFGYYDSSNIWLRENVSGSAYLVWSGLPNLGVFRTIKLAVNDNLGTPAWELFIDGVSYGFKAKANSFIINTIGKAYSTYFVDASFKQGDVTIHNASVTTILNDLSNVVGAIDVDIQATKKISPIPIGAALSPLYISYESTGYSGREKIIVYVRRGTTSKYAGFIIGHDYDMSDAVYSDQFRIVGADDYILSDGAMVLTVPTTLTVGESECVWKRDGSADFTGGWHGDEIYQSVMFMINGVSLDMSEDFELVPASEFYYLQKSTMHETMTDVTPVPGHPKECDHIKLTSFRNSTFDTFNRLAWSRTVPVEIWYHNLFCLGKMQATKGYNEDFNIADFTGSLAELLKKVGLREFHSYNDSNEYSADITSKVIKPESFDSEATMWVSDRASDSKYYRRIVDKDPVLNDVWESFMSVNLNAI